jgi:hypothetical protein
MVRDQIRDRLAYSFEDLGAQSVKNIARPVRVYALRPEAIAGLPAPNAPAAVPIAHPVAAPRLSIVVLPFANLGNDPDQQYFADGVTEDLTTDLSRIAGMFVISRNTAFTYKDKRVDTKQIGVAYLASISTRERSGRLLPALEDSGRLLPGMEYSGRLLPDMARGRRPLRWPASPLQRQGAIGNQSA